MTGIRNQEALAERARNLGSLNGLKLAFVSLDPPAAPVQAWLDLEFHNTNILAAILSDIGGGTAPSAIFMLTGGSRLRAGTAPGQVQVLQAVAGAQPNVLRVRIAPIGDYSTYTLALRDPDPTRKHLPYPGIDPLFAEIKFKFRPGCFNLNCAPTWPASPPLSDAPAIDYLARDYDSFKHVLMSAMQTRVPNWQPTSEADLDQVLIDLIAVDADELSDFQDRVVNEGYFATARKRVSLARHARLVDYHIHQGNQATTWLALKVSSDVVIPAGFGVWTGRDWQNAGSVIFLSQEQQSCFAWLSELTLYDWGGVVTALDAGSVEADLALPASLDATVEADADQLRDLFRSGFAPRLLVQQALNPETGTVNGRDIGARQIVQLLEGEAAADTVQDPMTGNWLVRVRWRDADKLARRYCFLTQCPDVPPQEDVSLFHGNLIRVAQGRPTLTIFRPPGAPLANPNTGNFIVTSEAHYESTKWGVLCALPYGPLAYRSTAPGGDTPPQSSLTVMVGSQPWDEQTDLIESESDDEHFIVETDELQRSEVRFGNNVNGRALSLGSVVTCTYQVGQGALGNVGADKLIGFDAVSFPEVTQTWNPLDVTDGRDPESPAVILRRAPEAYRQRQLRAVTLEDYVKRAEELDSVSHAAARYAWTGSWRTVRVAIDPRGTTTLDETTRKQIENYLNAVRLIGEDLEIRPAQYVPLDIGMRLCAHPDYWISDLDAVLQQEFSDGYTPDGRPGFFHPDNWTFGQPLYASQLIGRALGVTGVGRVLSISIRRWHSQHGVSTVELTLAPEDMPESLVEKLDVTPFEIIQVANNPDHLEQGRILFSIEGGRR
jgi:hypothetical protein